MKVAIQLILALLLLAGTLFYVRVIDAPERWLSPGAVELSVDGMRLSLTNVSNKPVTVKQLGFAWKVSRFKYEALLLDQPPREIAPGETYIETCGLMDIIAVLPAIEAADKFSLTLTIHVDGKRKGGLQKLSRLPVVLHNSIPRN